MQLSGLDDMLSSVFLWLVVLALVRPALNSTLMRAHRHAFHPGGTPDLQAVRILLYLRSPCPSLRTPNSSLDSAPRSLYRTLCALPSPSNIPRCSERVGDPLPPFAMASARELPRPPRREAVEVVDGVHQPLWVRASVHLQAAREVREHCPVR